MSFGFMSIKVLYLNFYLKGLFHHNMKVTEEVLENGISVSPTKDFGLAQGFGFHHLGPEIWPMTVENRTLTSTVVENSYIHFKNEKNFGIYHLLIEQSGTGPWDSHNTQSLAFPGLQPYTKIYDTYLLTEK